MTEPKLENMSKEELIRELHKLQSADRRFAARVGEADRERLIHDLHVYQVELEMQNRELREAQVHLGESRDRYTDLYDFAPVGYCTLDAKGYIREINLTGAALLGVARDALLGNLFPSVAPLKDARPFYSHMKRCAKENVRVESELQFSVGKRGAQAVRLISDPGRGESGSTTAFRTMLVDISDLKALEDRLRLLSEAGELLASSLEYSATLDAAARIAVPALADLCMFDVLSNSGTVERQVVLFADKNKQARLAERAMQFSPRPGWRTPQERVIASSQPMLLSEVSSELRERISHNDGHADPLRAADIRSIIVAPLHARGRTFGALTLACAESERVYASIDLQVALGLASRVATALDNARLYGDAQRAIAARDATLSLVSHDLRNALGVILLNVRLMLKGTAKQDEWTQTRKSVESVQRAAERMKRLIQDLLDVSVIEAGRFTVERSRHCVGTLMREVLEELQMQAAAKSLRLTCDVTATADVDCECDGERVVQVLSNLIGNAIKFTAPEGTILVGAELRDGELRVFITDTGPGISAADLPHVFDRFWQVQQTARMGTGLGLSISKGIVEAHGGRLWVESRVGVGSTFYFTLPRAHPGLERAAPPDVTSATYNEAMREARAGESRGPDRVVLIAEDDDDAREVLCDTLEQAGYTVATASNGAEALEYLHRKAAPFVVILDLMMPVMDGWAFLAERNRDPGLRLIPVIVVSGERDVEKKVAAAHASYIQKPILADHLIKVMQQMVID